MMGNVDHPARWHHHDPFRLRHRHGHGGPLRRDPADRLGGGVAAGVAGWRGINVTTVRIGFVLLTSGGAVALYVVAWLLIPAAGSDTNIASRARSDARGIRLAAGLASLLILVLLVAGALGARRITGWAWPQVASVAGLVLIWRNATADEQVTLRHLVGPLEGAAASQPGTAGWSRRSAVRLTIATLLLFGGAGWLFSAHASLALLRPLGGVALVIAAVVLFLGPWWLRIARDLVLERQARVRAEERAD